MLRKIVAILLIAVVALTVVFVVLPALPKQGCIPEENFFSNSPRFIELRLNYFRQTGGNYQFGYTDTSGVRQVSEDFGPDPDIARVGLTSLLSDGQITPQQYQCGLELSGL
jgi:hypothetical protein